MTDEHQQRRYVTLDGIAHWSVRWAGLRYHMRTLWCDVNIVQAEGLIEVSVDISDAGIETVTCLDCIAGLGAA